MASEGMRKKGDNPDAEKPAYASPCRGGVPAAGRGRSSVRTPALQLVALQGAARWFGGEPSTVGACPWRVAPAGVASSSPGHFDGDTVAWKSKLVIMPALMAPLPEQLLAPRRVEFRK